MAKRYIDKILTEIFQGVDNTAERQMSEAGQIHHAIITRSNFENAYASGLSAHNIPYTLQDLKELGDAFEKGLKAEIKRLGLTSKRTNLSGGGLILSSKVRDTNSKVKSQKSLQDIKACVNKGKVSARVILDKIITAGNGTTKGAGNQAGKIQGGFQYGHGEGGGSISTQGTERGLAVIKKINSKDAEKELAKYVTNGDIFLQTFNTSIADYYKKDLNWDVIRVDPNSKKAKISDNLEITGAFVKQNPDFSAKYDLPGPDASGKWIRRFKDTFRKELYKALDSSKTAGGILKRGELEGSPSPVKRAQLLSARQVVEEFEKALKGADMRGVVTVKTALEKIGKTKTKDKGKARPLKKTKKGITKLKHGKKIAASKTKRGVARSQKQVSPLALKSLLQKALPDAIAKKMTGRPTLMYQTGRFAQSAEIMDIVPMQKQVEIRYDYMQDPYRVFEPGSGSPLATTGRDPRKIIGGTIRELAQQVMGSRFLIRTKRA